jgi:heme ABC exporter ATP-binding subunit CcmA
LAARKEALLLELVELDERHDSGELPADDYRRLRQARKEELVATLRALGGIEGGEAAAPRRAGGQPSPLVSADVAGEAAIVVRGVRVAFGATVVLRGVDLTVPWGARLALLGPNGAGKSTLLRTIATLSRPNAGAVLLAGIDASRRARRRARLIGVVAHQTYLYDELTALENLRFYADLYDLPAAAGRAAALLERVGLTARRNVRASSLSRGQQQRLTLARALLHDPPLLLLDEPDTGLDLAAFGLLESLLLGEERTVVLTTHNLRQAARLCDRYAILAGGRIVREGGLQAGDGGDLEEVYREQTEAVARRG